MVELLPRAGMAERREEQDVRADTGLSAPDSVGFGGSVTGGGFSASICPGFGGRPSRIKRRHRRGGGTPNIMGPLARMFHGMDVNQISAQSNWGLTFARGR